MRTTSFTIGGEKHLLCFSTRVVRSCVERFGEVSGIFDALADESRLRAFDSAIWILARLMDAGDRYAKKNGLENPPPLSEEDLLDLCGMEDLADVNRAIGEAVTGGSARTVEAKPSKNTEAPGADGAAERPGSSGTD